MALFGRDIWADEKQLIALFKKHHDTFDEKVMLKAMRLEAAEINLLRKALVVLNKEYKLLNEAVMHLDNIGAHSGATKKEYLDVTDAMKRTYASVKLIRQMLRLEK